MFCMSNLKLLKQCLSIGTSICRTNLFNLSIQGCQSWLEFFFFSKLAICVPGAAVTVEATLVIYVILHCQLLSFEDGAATPAIRTGVNFVSA